MNAAERLLRDLSLLLELCLVTGEQDDLDQLVERWVERAVLKICAANALLFVRVDPGAGSKVRRFRALPNSRAQYWIASTQVDGVTSGIEAALAAGRVQLKPGSESVAARISIAGLQPPEHVLSIPIHDVALLELYARERDVLDEHTGKVLSSLAAWLAHRITRTAQHETDRQRLLELSEQKEGLEEILGGLPGVAWRLDAAGKLIYVSAGSRGLLGHPPELLVAAGDPRLLLIREADRDRVMDELARAVSARLPYVALTYRIWRGGEHSGESAEIDERLALTYEPGGELRGQIGFLSDVTIARTALRRIEELNAQRTAVARADALRVDTERASKAKTEFLNLLSHELRAPLFPIIALSDLLLRVDEAELESGEWRDQVRMINTAGKQMLQLVTDLLDISRVDAGRTRPNPGPIMLSHFASAVEQRHQERARARGAKFRVEVAGSNKGSELYTDRAILERILAGLLTHAFEHLESKEVTLQLEAKSAAVMVRVIAAGITTTAQIQPDIFEPFWERSDSARSESRGHGLALAVVKRLVQSFGGSVRAEGGDARLVFEAELPCALAELRLPLARVPRAVIGSSELASVFGLALTVQAMGADVRIVPSAGELVDLAKRRAFDVLLVDVRLPGLRVLEELLHSDRVAGTFHPHVVGLSRPGDPISLTGVVADEAMALPPSKEKLAAMLARFSA